MDDATVPIFFFFRIICENSKNKHFEITIWILLRYPWNFSLNSALRKIIYFHLNQQIFGHRKKFSRPSLSMERSFFHHFHFSFRQMKNCWKKKKNCFNAFPSTVIKHYFYELLNFSFSIPHSHRVFFIVSPQIIFESNKN